MKTLSKYLNEKLVINKDYKDTHAYTSAPKSFDELREIIKDKYNKFGPGTKDTPVDFNDVDVSNINSFYNENINIGIFQRSKFEYIDISYWDVSKVKIISRMFYSCTQLKSIGDLSEWDVSNCENTNSMFFMCEQLKSVGDLSNWNVSKVEDMGYMFYRCKKLTSVGDLSNWKVSNVKRMDYMFKGSGILNMPKWYRS